MFLERIWGHPNRLYLIEIIIIHFVVTSLASKILKEGQLVIDKTERCQLNRVVLKTRVKSDNSTEIKLNSLAADHREQAPHQLLSDKCKTNRGADCVFPFPVCWLNMSIHSREITKYTVQALEGFSSQKVKLSCCFGLLQLTVAIDGFRHFALSVQACRDMQVRRSNYHIALAEYNFQ